MVAVAGANALLHCCCYVCCLALWCFFTFAFVVHVSVVVSFWFHGCCCVVVVVDVDASVGFFVRSVVGVCDCSVLSHSYYMSEPISMVIC